MRGFTLLEIMIALAIMAGVILTVITSFNYHLSVVSRDKEETIAVLLAGQNLKSQISWNWRKRPVTSPPITRK